MLNAYLNEVSHDRQQHPDKAAAEQSLLHSAYRVKEELEKRMVANPVEKLDYHFIVLPTVDRDRRLKPDTRKIPGIMKLHEVTFDSAAVLRVKQLSSDASADVVHVHFNSPWQLGKIVLRLCWMCFGCSTLLFLLRAKARLYA